MSSSQSERTLQMRKKFMDLHGEGLGIPAIAKQFDLAPKTVYLYLDEIAKEAGVSREDLLQRPFWAYRNVTNGRKALPAPINLIDFYQDVEKTLSDFDQTIETVNQYIAAQEHIQVEEAAKC